MTKQISILGIYEPSMGDGYAAPLAWGSDILRTIIISNFDHIRVAIISRRSDSRLCCECRRRRIIKEGSEHRHETNEVRRNILED